MSAIRPGEVLAGKYEVQRVLGAGGMGYVVAARHMQLDQIVAMKFIRGNVLESDEAKKRFVREAKASARLKSEHVARVFDVGTLESGDPYMVMEYLEGADLAVIAKERGALPVGEAVEYVLQACEALAEAHGQGIIHRDIKLANLFVTRGPTGMPLVKLLDFGISKVNPFAETNLDMTTTSAMLGSPRFMSPEQMKDPRTVDPRSDLWSLGVVLYRLLAGRGPFEADNLARLFTMVMNEPVAPPDGFVPLPPGLGAVVMRCLEKDRERRFLNVAELAAALAPYSLAPNRAFAVAEGIAMVLAVPSPAASSQNLSAISSREIAALSSLSGPNVALSSSGAGAPRPPLSSSQASVMSASVADAILQASRHASGPPGASETGGTAAWGGTHAQAIRERSKGPLYALGGFVMVSLLASAFVLHSRMKQSEASTDETSAATLAAPPATSPPPPTVVLPPAPTTAQPLLTAPDVPPTAAPTLLAPPTPLALGATASAAPKPAPPPRKTPGITPKLEPKPPTPTGPGGPAKGGIPDTRD
ncbi:MAG: serine/threonine protein kinase [Myxococcales bacterium]|jgi:serine/threonine-protein kinase|nr:serine/threonine protein kinase [Myxococcales bacterium]